MARRYGPCWLLLGLLLVVAGCSRPAEAKRTFHKVRQPAVAGIFYPADPQNLGRTVDKLLAQAKTVELKNLRGLVCPHAGYEFSGRTAGAGFKQLVGRRVRTVIVLGPSHYARFSGAAVADADAYATPLGPMPVAGLAAELAKEQPFVLESPCDVDRPDWIRSPKQAPAVGKDTPHTWEHSVEVEVPFLQRAAPRAEIVPVVLGSVDPARAARTLVKHLGPGTVLVVSSDLSHYHPYEVAQRLDRQCVQAICDLDIAKMEQAEACGKGPILVLLHIAKEKHWRATLLDACNSGDTGGDRSRGVVGYAAVAFTAPDEGPDAKEDGKEDAGQPANGRYTPGQRKFMLELARQGDSPAGRRGGGPCLARRRRGGRAGREAGVLRHAHQERRAARLHRQYGPPGAALPGRDRQGPECGDRRPPFPAGQKPEELEQLHIEISVLTVPQELAFDSPADLLRKLRPGTDGVVLRVDGRQATFLPQVWEQLPDKEEFLAHLSQKAGLSATAWKDPEAKVLVYQVEAFQEGERGPSGERGP